jgi:hypothetical protein
VSVASRVGAASRPTLATGDWPSANQHNVRILEIISPGGFEYFCAELVDLGGVAQADPPVLGGVCVRYALDMDGASRVSSSASDCAFRPSRLGPTDSAGQE